MVLCGFQLFEWHWNTTALGRVITLVVVEDGMPPGMADRVEDAGQMWASPSVHFVILRGQDSSVGQGVVRMGSTSLTGHMGTARLATPDGHLARCIILVEEAIPVEKWYTGREGPPPDQYDVWTLLGHELGHCLGLEHEDNATPPALMRTFIHPGEVQHSLSPDDRAGRDALFPPAGPGGGGCGERTG